MMGILQKQSEFFSYQVHLDKRVRRDHRLRKVAEVIDFSFVRDEVAQFYGVNGNVSVDPVVLMKMLLLLFLDDIASERELMTIIPERLDYLWFLGYGLDDEIPDHSVLSKARARWGREVFEKLFVRTVMQCVEAGLVDGAKIHMDASLVKADASKDSVLKGGPELIAALKEVYATQEQKLEEQELHPYEVVNNRMVSTTDSDAAVVRQGGMSAGLFYKNHRVVDDAHGVITAVETTSGNTDEGGRLMNLVDQHQVHTERAVGTVIADSKYGTTENFRKCQQKNIRTHMASLQSKLEGTGSRRGIFSEKDFKYDELMDCYHCPGGKRLTRRNFSSDRRAYEYKITSPKLCAVCELRNQCTRAKDGRSLKRFMDQPLIEKGRAQSQSRAALADRRRRKHLMERSFADAANNHHFKRSRWRRLWRQQIQNYLIAAIQNIRILLAHVPQKPKAILVMAMQNPIPSLQKTLLSFLAKNILLNDLFLKLQKQFLNSIPLKTF